MPKAPSSFSSHAEGKETEHQRRNIPCSHVLFLPRAPRNGWGSKGGMSTFGARKSIPICANNLIRRRISQRSNTTGQRTATRPGCRRADDTDRTLARPSTLKPPDDDELFLDGGSHASHGPVMIMIHQPSIGDIWSSLLDVFPRTRLPT